MNVTANPAREPSARTRARKPRRTLTPVDITSRFPSFRSGRLETWSAKSRDGLWAYERIEDTGTPWEITHVPSGLCTDWYGTLSAARAATANGSALADIERQQAHDRGEHAERVLFCRSCTFERTTQ
jgi:hypothetical protein